MFEDQFSADEKINSKEVGEKKDCWEEERKGKKIVSVFPALLTPTPDPSVHLKPLCRQVAVSAKSRRPEKLGSGKSLKNWSQPFMTTRSCTATRRRQ